MLVLHFIYSLCSGVETSRHQTQDNDISMDVEVHANVTRTKAFKGLKSGRGSSKSGRYTQDLVKDDGRRDADYKEEALRRAQDGSVDNIRSTVGNIKNKSLFDESRSVSDHQGNGLYNEAGRNELKMFEAKYEASLKNIKGSKEILGANQQSGDADERNREAPVDADEYDDGMDLRADVVEELDDAGPEGKTRSARPHTIDTWESSHVNLVEDEKQDVEEADKGSSDSNSEETLSDPQISRVIAERQPARRLIPRPGSKKKPKHRKVSGNCNSFHIIPVVRSDELKIQHF